MDQPQKLQEAIRLLYDNGWHLAAFRLRRGIWGPAEAAERLRMGIGTREPALASEAESKALSILDELSSPVSEPRPATRSIDVTLERAREIMRFVEYWANERPGEAMILDLGDGDPGPWQSVTHTRERLGGRVRDRIDAVRLVPPVSEEPVYPPRLLPSEEVAAQEIARLVALLEAHGIDPESRPAPPPVSEPGPAPPPIGEFGLTVDERGALVILLGANDWRRALSLEMSRALAVCVLTAQDPKPPEGQGIDLANRLRAVVDSQWAPPARLEIAIHVAADWIETVDPAVAVPAVVKRLSGWPCHPDAGERSILDQALQILRGEKT
jgi:hypothetical protein